MNAGGLICEPLPAGTVAGVEGRVAAGVDVFARCKDEAACLGAGILIVWPEGVEDPCTIPPVVTFPPIFFF